MCWFSEAVRFINMADCGCYFGLVTCRFGFPRYCNVYLLLELLLPFKGEGGILEYHVEQKLIKNAPLKFRFKKVSIPKLNTVPNQNILSITKEVIRYCFCF